MNSLALRMLKTSLKRANSNCSGTGSERNGLNSNPDARIVEPLGSEPPSRRKPSLTPGPKPKRSASLAGTTIQKMKTRSLSLTKTLSLKHYSPNEIPTPERQNGNGSISKSKPGESPAELMRVEEVEDDDDNVFMV